jgi:ribosomal protein L16 Arg81 hydroxylase
VSAVTKLLPALQKNDFRHDRRTTPLVRIDASFWKEFAETYWEKQAQVFKNISSPLLELDQNEIFLLLVLYSDRCRKSKNAEGMKFYVDGHRQFETETLRLLPKKSDRTLAGYHERMSELFPDYCLVCDELLQVNHTKQDKLIEFTRELYRAVGFPNRFAEMGLYLGNYRKTPFGVHVDGCGVFSFPVAGKKTFRIWKPDYVSLHPKLEQAFSYAKHKAHSQVLTARPGDMTYWPSQDWHIAESDGSFSATWSLGVWVDQKHSEDFAKILTALVSQMIGHDAASGMTTFKSLHSETGEVTALPELYKRSIESLRQISREQLDETFLKAWMSHTSKLAFKNRPPSDFSITRKSVIRLRSLHAPIQWMRSPIDRKIYYSFAGVLTEGSNSKSLLSLIQKMNNGEVISVATFVKATDVNEFESLSRLAAAGAFAASRKPSKR